MWGWYDGGTGWAGWLLMVAVMVVFWAMVLWAVMAIFRSTQTPAGGGGAPHRSPMDILDERFARGEIDETEYRARAEVLRTHVS